MKQILLIFALMSTLFTSGCTLRTVTVVTREPPNCPPPVIIHRPVVIYRHHPPHHHWPHRCW